MTESMNRYAFGAHITNTTQAGPLSLGKLAFLADSDVGRYVSLGDFSSVQRAKVGSFCSFGSRVSINPFSHPTDWLSHHEFQYRGDSYDFVPEYTQMRRLERTPDMFGKVEIGNDVWIGHNAVVVGDVKIGDGAVIAAGAVVTKDVAPYAIVGGVPAKVIRFRFASDIIARLLAVKWWDLPLKKLSGLPFKDIEQCLESLETERFIEGSQWTPEQVAARDSSGAPLITWAEVRAAMERASHKTKDMHRITCATQRKDARYGPCDCGAQNFFRPPLPDQMLTEQFR